jgi:ribosomal protein S18 acetylase RimI-like enzyme
MVTKPRTLVRPARRADLPDLGRLGAALAQAHHDWDPQRFFMVDEMADGYAWWLGRELRNDAAVVLVAEQAGRIVGYAYGRLEERDWNALRDACGEAVDLIVDPEARGTGAGLALMQGLVSALEGLGAPRVVLYAAARNRKAQRFFRALGFRPTMVEMTREAGGATKRRRRQPATRAR